MKEASIKVYIDIKDGRIHDSQTCPTLSRRRQGKLQDWGRMSRQWLESPAAKDPTLPFKVCSFCFPAHDDDEESEPSERKRLNPCPKCGVEMARRRVTTEMKVLYNIKTGQIVSYCLNCGEVVEN